MVLIYVQIMIENSQKNKINLPKPKMFKKFLIFHKNSLLNINILNNISKKNWSYFLLKSNTNFIQKSKEILKFFINIRNNLKLTIKNDTKFFPKYKVNPSTRSVFLLSSRNNFFKNTINIIGHFCWPWIFDIHNFDLSNEDTALEVNKPFVDKIIDKSLKSIKPTKRLNFLMNRVYEDLTSLIGSTSISILKKKNIKLLVTKFFIKLKQIKKRSRNLNKIFKILTSLNLTTFNSTLLNALFIKVLL